MEKTRILGKCGLKVSAVGLGCMGMSHAYGAPADRRDMTELLAEAVGMGYTLFDTAEAYGTQDNPHDNEELLGEALRPFRDKVVIATKFGISFGSDGDRRTLVTDSRTETIRRSVEGSLRRLRTDHIDLYYQHRPDSDVEPETVAEAMAGLIREGKILHWGVSEASEEYVRRAHKVCPLTAIQNRYSMMARWHEPWLDVCEELGIGFVAFSPLANGILSMCYSAGDNFDQATDYRASMPQYQKESYEANAALFKFLNELAERHHATPAQVSLAWMMGKRPWIVPIPGTRHLSRLKENFGAADIDLSAEEIRQIDATLDKMPMSGVYGGARVVAAKV